MKIQIASDLHLDLLEAGFPGYRVIEPTDADLLVIAGDIHHGTTALQIFADWPVPVIYVHGNHEAYRHELDELIAALRAQAQGSNVHFLERDELVIEGVRFLGCCLWTDYQLAPFDTAAAMQEAEKFLYDHRLIRTQQGIFSAADAQRIHAASRAWLAEKLNETFDGPTVVVTHHGPHPNSVHERFAASIINAAFVSDLTPLLGQADLWIHGHVHDSFDYEVAGARVVTNPRGYATNRRAAQSIEQIVWENPAFDPTLVVEVT